jgi:hypothetical protein
MVQFDFWLSICLEMECIRYANVWYSDPQCITLFMTWQSCKEIRSLLCICLTGKRSTGSSNWSKPVCSRHVQEPDWDEQRHLFHSYPPNPWLLVLVRFPKCFKFVRILSMSVLLANFWKMVKHRSMLIGLILHDKCQLQCFYEKSPFFVKT